MSGLTGLWLPAGGRVVVGSVSLGLWCGEAQYKGKQGTDSSPPGGQEVEKQEGVRSRHLPKTCPQ